MEEIEKVYFDKDYIAIKRFDYSLKKVLQRYPDGAPDRVIAQALLIEEDEVEQIYQQAVAKLRKVMVND